MTVRRDIPAAWRNLLLPNMPDSLPEKIDAFLAAESDAGYKIFPGEERRFAALQMTPPEEIRAVILGQDPYHEPGQAHGLAFSVQDPTPLPPSLVNIYKEIEDDLGIKCYKSGDLSRWAKQGVLLLNTVLTVEAGKAFSHAGHGWETFTRAALEYAAAQADTPLAAVLWGKPVATVYIRPQRYTLEFVEREDTFTLCFFGEEYRKALALCGSKSGRDIEQLLVARGELSGSAREIVQMARERRVPVKEVDRARLDAITRNHQGMLAFASAYRYSTVEDMLDLARERGEAPFLILLDGITDPHNLGAIIRTAECAGAHGVIVQERRAVGLTPAAVKASAGAVEYLPVARVTNLTSTIERLKREGVWTYAADMAGEDYASLDLTGPIALVIGAEGEGVGRRVLESCDRAVSVPIRGKLDSLNASVAAGVLMYAVLRAR